MATIELTDLSFGYPGQPELFSHVSFNFDTRWHLGLVGRNGRGKTTLLELLQHQHEYRGQITTPLTFNYFPQPIADKSQLTLYAMQAVSDAEQWELERELNLMHVDPDILWRPYQALSGGEQTKVRLALLFTQASGFALIDEPTNHLDQASRALVAQYLQQKSGFILISHDRAFLNATTDHTLAIDKADITLYQGNYDVYAAARDRQNAFEQAENSKLKHEIGRLQQSARAKGQWADSREKDINGSRHEFNSAHKDRGRISHMAAREMKKRLNLEHRMDKEIDAKSKLLKNIEDVPALTINTLPDHHDPYLHVVDLTVGYEQSLFKPVSFDVRPGDRVALVGPNGIGKSSLLRAVLGQFSGTTTGTITQPQLKLSLMRQVPDNRGLLKDFAAAHHLDYESLLNNLKKLGLERSAFTTPIEQLSMGQQKKVELARSLVTPANLLVWDEPLNYLDLYNQDQLAQSLQANQPTLLFIEHDQAFIDRVATKIVILEPAQA